ncbi:hypothetical protein GCM10028895_28330 [Pontibacter rugosus]
MKTYLRILQYAKPYSRFVPLYSLYTILGIIFGLFNFTLLVPLLDVLFGKVGQQKAVLMAATKPDFALNLEFFKEFFYYHFGQIILQEGRAGALLLSAA